MQTPLTVHDFLVVHAAITRAERRLFLRSGAGRILCAAGALGGLGVFGTPAMAALGLSDTEAATGLRAALERGAESAVGLLGQPDGFLGNPKVRIPLPGWLEKPAKLMKATGLGPKLDELVTTMNRAAEAAIPEAKPVLVQAVKSLNITDARKILTGGDNAVTQFFADKTRSPLGEKFLPIVTRSTARLDLTGKLNSLLGQASSFGLVKKDTASIEQYVTGKTLDGLFLMIGEEERRIRQDPIGTGSAVLKKVFGSLR